MSLHIPHVTRSVVVDLLTGRRVCRTITSIDGVSLKEDTELTPDANEQVKVLIKESIERDETLLKFLNTT